MNAGHAYTPDWHLQLFPFGHSWYTTKWWWCSERPVHPLECQLASSLMQYKNSITQSSIWRICPWHNNNTKCQSSKCNTWTLYIESHWDNCKLRLRFESDSGCMDHSQRVVSHRDEKRWWHWLHGTYISCAFSHAVLELYDMLYTEIAYQDLA